MKRIFQKLLTLSLLIYAFNLSAQQPAPPSAPPPAAQPAPAPSPTPTPNAAPAPAANPAPTTASPSPSPSTPSQATPATAAPAPAANSGSKDIPVISIGDQVKPMAGSDKEKPKDKTSSDTPASSNTPTPKKVVKRAVSQRVSKVEANTPLLLESRQLIHSRLSQVGDEVVFVVAENYPKNSPLLPKGTIVVGKISAIQRMDKDQPAGIRVNLEAVFGPSGNAIPISGTWEVIRQKGQDNWGGKEAFAPVGFRQAANINKKFSTRVSSRPTKIKPPKGQLSAPGEIEEGNITIKLGDLRYPTRIEAIVEAPQGMDVTNLKEDSIKIVRINDFTLPRPLTPLDDKIKIADRNKNKVKDIGYKFTGWDFVRYLPEGTSSVVMSAQTKDGKPVEIIATVKTEYK